MNRVPPPLPARARKASQVSVHEVNPPQSRAPMPSDEGFMSTTAKMSLADVACALRDEQLQARIAHYRADLETNPELDAITAQVVAELQQLQKKSARDPSVPPPPADRTQIEIELIDSLKQQLRRLFRTEKLASVFERKLAEASKRFARLFFASELHDKIRGTANEAKTMRYAEQALYHVFMRTEAYLMQELASFEFTSPQVLARAREIYSGMVRELRNDFLGRTTPELNSLVSVLNEVLTRFLTAELPPFVGELAWQVVKEARLGEARLGSGYKLSATSFPRFRAAFERHFLRLLVPYVEEAMLKRVREGGESKFRVETLRFVADPQIFSAVCELICDAVYDFLYNEGFLDLPSDWRAHLTDAG
jgi:hypothetical protein